MRRAENLIVAFGCSAEKSTQLGVGFVWDLLGGVVPARQHFPADVNGAFPPSLDRFEAAVHVASLSPQNEDGHRELLVQVRFVMSEVDSDRCPIVLADRVDVFGRATAD